MPWSCVDNFCAHKDYDETIVYQLLSSFIFAMAAMMVTPFFVSAFLFVAMKMLKSYLKNVNQGSVLIHFLFIFSIYKEYKKAILKMKILIFKYFSKPNL